VWAKLDPSKKEKVSRVFWESPALAAVQALALRAMADRLEHHKAVPEELLNLSFIAA